MRRLDARLMLPTMSLVLLLGIVAWLRPNAMSYGGLNLLLNYAVPVVLATIAQMIVIMVDDIDLSIGTFVSFVACVTATMLADNPPLGIIVLLAAVGVQAALGALIEWRKLPAIVVTLGMSFVWGGLAVLLLPSPGGIAPPWLRAIMTVKPPLAPMAIVACVILAAIGHLLVTRSATGTLLRAVGGNARSVARAGHNLIAMRALAYGLAGVFGVLSGMALVGLATSADANIALRYTLLSIAGVILGGGQFTGGRVSPVGAVIGALTLTLAAAVLSFLRLSPDWQIGAQGVILIMVLAARLLISRGRPA